MVSKIGRLLFKIARSPLAGYFIGFSFQYLSFLIPVQRVLENGRVLAFHHPRPFWQTHLLVVPKQVVPTLISVDVEDSDQIALLQQILMAAEQVASLCELERYAILVNGLAYQDVPQLHFHVAGGADGNGELFGEEDLGEIEFEPKQFWNVYQKPVANGRHQTMFVAQNDFELEAGAAEVTELFQLVYRQISLVEFAGFSVRFARRSFGAQITWIVILAGELAG